MPVSGVLESLLQYWKELPKAGQQSLPCRSALNPLSLLELLPRVALLKRLDRYNVQACMMSMSDADVWHRPFVGMNAFDLTSPHIRECRAKFYEAILDHPAASYLRETVHQKDGRSALVKSLYLPMCDKLGMANYIMACSVYENQPKPDQISNRLVLDHKDIKELEFIDIGHGKPHMEFERPEPRQAEEDDLNWWQRIMPLKPKGSSSGHLDA